MGRFTRTLDDLRDALEYMDYPDLGSGEEHRAREELIRLCVEIASDYGDEER